MIARSSGAGNAIARYEISDREMAVGSTLGAPKAVLLIKATGAMEKLYSVDAGADVFGTLVLHHWDERSGIPLSPAPGVFVIHPYHQEHLFDLAGDIGVREDLFVLNGAPEGEDRRSVDPPAAYYAVELENRGDDTAHIATYASLQVPASGRGAAAADYDAARHAFIIRNGDDDFVRIAACSVRPHSYEMTLDSAKTSASHFPGTLSNEVADGLGEPILIFHLSHHLKPGTGAAFSFALTFSLEGEAEARCTFASLPGVREGLRRTGRHYDAVLDRAVVVTPDSEVNRGVLWAKANMLRTQLLTSQGWCFVNDPTRSNNSVGRDTAWFAFGDDYVTPEFAAESLLWYIEHLEPDGMVVEYFDVRNGKTDDYGLNINDNTPLLLLAIWHHYGISGDREFLERAYPNALRAARYILSQRDERGLVWCTADGTADWGIVGWRNVIKGYRLSGATTEVNSECYAALRTMAQMSAELGDSDQSRDFSEAAAQLRSAVNEHLLDKRRNLYYLNIGLDGTKYTDVTSDLVFPVMFGVADHDVAANIIARLSIPDFWSDAGLHTVPRNDINYGPTHGYGLLGGVWGGPTFWFAFAAAAFNPESMAYALSTSFRHYAHDPRRNNTVPGQFAEWLHGETLTNQGMMLSPWFAPKYVWAAIEGAAGLDVSGSEPTLSPRPAHAWEWIGVHNVELRGKQVTWFVVRADELRMYANYPFASVDPRRRYEDDITDDVHLSGEDAVRLALLRPDRAVVFLGNTRDRTISVSVSTDCAALRGPYRLRSYNSLRGEWIEAHGFDPHRLERGIPVQLNRRGFCILEFETEA